MKRVLSIAIIGLMALFVQTASAQTFNKVSKWKWGPSPDRFHQTVQLGGGMTMSNGSSATVTWVNPVDGSSTEYELKYLGGSSMGLTLGYHLRYNLVEAMDRLSFSMGVNPNVQVGLGSNPATNQSGFGMAAIVPLLFELNVGHASTFYDFRKGGIFLGAGAGGMIQMAPGYFAFDYGPAASFGLRWHGTLNSWTFGVLGGYGLAGLTAGEPTVTVNEVFVDGTPNYTIDGVGGVTYASIYFGFNIGGY